MSHIIAPGRMPSTQCAELYNLLHDFLRLSARYRRLAAFKHSSPAHHLKPWYTGTPDMAQFQFCPRRAIEALSIYHYSQLTLLYDTPNQRLQSCLVYDRLALIHIWQPGHEFFSRTYPMQRRQFIPQGAIKLLEILIVFFRRIAAMIYVFSFVFSPTEQIIGIKKQS